MASNTKWMLAIAALASLVWRGAYAQTENGPTIRTERNGNVTNLVVEGQLAPTRDLDCIDVASVQRVFTPPDIHTAIRRCVAQGDFDRAMRLTLVAGIFARFDAERVADVSARDAGQVLIYQTSQRLTPDQRAEFKRVYDALTHDPVSLRSLCTQVEVIGPPDYTPTYMILHGAELIARKMNNLPAAEPLVPGFDAGATWSRLQQAYLHCP